MFFDELPPDACQRCLAGVRATELCAGLAACSRALRRTCQSPSLWREEVRSRFPEVYREMSSRSECLVSWRGALLNALREHLLAERLRLAALEKRTREALQVAEARRHELCTESDYLAHTSEELRARLGRCRQEAADADSWRASGAVGGSVVHGLSSRRSTVARLWDVVEETRSALQKAESQQRGVERELSDNGPCSVLRLSRLRCQLEARMAACRRADAVLGRLPLVFAEKAPRAAEPARSSAAALPQRSAAGSRIARMAAAAGDRIAVAVSTRQSRSSGAAASARRAVVGQGGEPVAKQRRM